MKKFCFLKLPRKKTVKIEKLTTPKRNKDFVVCVKQFVPEGFRCFISVRESRVWEEMTLMQEAAVVSRPSERRVLNTQRKYWITPDIRKFMASEISAASVPPSASCHFKTVYPWIHVSTKEERFPVSNSAFWFFVTGKSGVDRTEEDDGVKMWRTIHDAT